MDDRTLVLPNLHTLEVVTKVKTEPCKFLEEQILLLQTIQKGPLAKLQCLFEEYLFLNPKKDPSYYERNLPTIKVRNAIKASMKPIFLPSALVRGVYSTGISIILIPDLISAIAIS